MIYPHHPLPPLPEELDDVWEDCVGREVVDVGREVVDVGRDVVDVGREVVVVGREVVVDVGRGGACSSVIRGPPKAFWQKSENCLKVSASVVYISLNTPRTSLLAWMMSRLLL